MASLSMEVFTTLSDVSLSMLWAGGMGQILSRGPFPPALLEVCTLLWEWEREQRGPFTSFSSSLSLRAGLMSDLQTCLTCSGVLTCQQPVKQQG